MSLQVRPDEETFSALSADWPLVPVWAELLADVSTPVGLFPAMAGDGPGVLLESVERSERWGRYSFVAGDPAAVLIVDRDGIRLDRVVRDLSLEGFDERPVDALDPLKAIARRLRAPRLPELPSLTGGLVGCLSYEAAELLEGHPHPLGGQDPPCPPIVLLVVDRAAVFDHALQRLLLVAHVPGGGPAAYRKGADALADLAERVSQTASPGLHPMAGEPATAALLRSNISDERFRGAVAAARENILAGDIFQVVLSRRLSVPTPGGGFPIYRRLRVTNPSPYMFFLRLPSGVDARGEPADSWLELAGSSPEPLVRVEGRRVATRPIAGTRPRGNNPGDDARLELQLVGDPKERAEHTMLVDLARNDLGRVSSPGSVQVTQLMQVERYARVMHLVSTVEGDLREGSTALDALAATFPAGTVTGAPKRRAMQIIAEHEPDARGPYAGAVGYLAFDGDLDFCITIRTAVVTGGVAQVQAGAGIVADSDPERELRETRAKASALLAAIGGVELASIDVASTEELPA
jgi:anthranilate synthase component I